MKFHSTFQVYAIGVLLVAGTLDSAAQYNHPKEPIDPTLSYQMVKTGLYMISGKGGNCLLRLSGNGLILVDANLPGNDQALLKGVHKISDQPVRLVILTSSDKSNIVNSEKLLETGAFFAVQENAKQNLMSSLPSADAERIKTYEREHLVRLGGIEVQVMHFGNAHTNADSVVYFPNLKVVAVGDLFSAPPNPDFAAGGSLVSWRPVLADVLKLDFDVAVPSKGPTVSRADLEAFKTKIDTLVSRATVLVKDGVPKEQLMGKLKTDDLGWQLSFTPEQVDHFYAELSQTQSGLSVVPSVGSTQTSSQLSGWQTANPGQSITLTELTQ
jgi:glyoxylase-like metal-dependent hydrolase (beta-lactamase superfamily II)